MNFSLKSHMLVFQWLQYLKNVKVRNDDCNSYGNTPSTPKTGAKVENAFDLAT